MASSSLPMNNNDPNRLWIPTGCNELDELLGGGIKTGTITEIIGKENSGKTSLALNLCFQLQQPPIFGGPRIGGGEEGDKKSIYIGTSNVEPRINQMANAFVAQYNQRIQQLSQDPTLFLSRPPSITVMDVLGKIFTTKCSIIDSFSQMVDMLEEALKLVINDKDIHLVVIDGVGSPFGNVQDNGILFNKKAQTIRKHVRELANEYNVAVVLTNQKEVLFDYSNLYFTPILNDYYAAWYPPNQMLHLTFEAGINKGTIKVVRSVYNRNGEGSTHFKIDNSGMVAWP